MMTMMNSLFCDIFAGFCTHHANAHVSVNVNIAHYR